MAFFKVLVILAILSASCFCGYQYRDAKAKAEFEALSAQMAKDKAELQKQASGKSLEYLQNIIEAQTELNNSDKELQNRLNNALRELDTLRLQYNEARNKNNCRMPSSTSTTAGTSTGSKDRQLKRYSRAFESELLKIGAQCDAQAYRYNELLRLYNQLTEK